MIKPSEADKYILRVSEFRIVNLSVNIFNVLLLRISTKISEDIMLLNCAGIRSYQHTSPPTEKLSKIEATSNLTH